MCARHAWGAVVLLLVLWLPAATAEAQVVDKNVTITDIDEPDTTGIANHSGASNSATGQTICRNGSNTVTVSGATTHPETLRLAKNTAKMDQRSLGNFPTIRVIGAGAVVYNVVLICESASLKSFVNYAPNVSAGSFDVRATNCSGLTQLRIDYLRDTCLADATNTTIELEFDGTTVTKLRLRGEGFTQ